MKFIDERIENYSVEKSEKPSAAVDAIESYTRANVHGSQMLIGKLEASLLGFLLRSIKAKNVLELGTFTGYSALAMAENLPDDGKLITIDISETTVQLAKQFWAKSSHGKKIESRLGPGIQVLQSMQKETPNLRFDLVFIDADKRNYKSYLETSLDLLSEKGLIVIDNVLWSGRVLPALDTSDNTDEHRNTQFIRELNDYLATRTDLYCTLLPIRDGMFLVQKKK